MHFWISLRDLLRLKRLEYHHHHQQQPVGESTAGHRRTIQHQDNIVEAIARLDTRIAGISGEQTASRHQANRHEHRKSHRDWFTFGALVATASAALLAMIVSHSDTRSLIKDEKHASTQQHNDTLAALTKTNDTISALKTQADTMRNQLSEMRNDKRAWLSPSTLDIRQIWGTGEHPDDYVEIVVTMLNTGREPAINTSFSVVPEVFKIDDIKRLGNTSTLLAITDIPLIKENASCADIRPIATGITIYPSVGGGFGSANGVESSIRITLWPTIYEMVTALHDKKLIMYFNGCLTYTTLGEVHHSKFCQFINIEGNHLAQMPFKYCPIGNEAD